MRKVKIFEWERVENQTFYSKVLKGEGVFHQFGISYETSEFGFGNFTTAIIEMPDGTIKNIEVELIQFIN